MGPEAQQVVEYLRPILAGYAAKLEAMQAQIDELKERVSECEIGEPRL